jgi:ankyrin repeat protein
LGAWPLVCLLVVGCTDAPQTPRDELAARNIPFTVEAFLRSAETGDLTAVNLFLAAGMDPNVKDRYGGTALRYAAAKGHLAVVQALLDKGADVNVQDTDGFTPLRYAVYNGHTEVVRALLDKGADVNVADKWGWTPLMIAPRGNLDIVHLLRAAGAPQ